MFDDGPSEYRVTIRVRNNLILSAIEQMGFKGHGSLARFAEYAGMEPTYLSALVAMRSRPLNKDGAFSEPAKQLMEALGAAPSDLWTAEQLNMCLERNTSEFEIDANGLRAVLGGVNEALPSPEDAAASAQMKEAVMDGLYSTLSPREEKVLFLRHGLGGMDEHTFQEVGDMFGVTRERIRQIEANAFRKLRGAKSILPEAP